MTYKLITAWSDYDSAVHEVLSAATQSISVFDENLTTLKLEKSERLALLRSFLSANLDSSLSIVVRDAQPVRSNAPRLMALLADFSHKVTILATPPHLATLRDSMVIADGTHAVIRFDEEQPRAKILRNDREACAPYVRRFNEIVSEGGDAISAMTLGL